METTENDHSIKKWNWMMNFCKQNQLPPAQKWAWDKAKTAWDEINEQWKQSQR